MAISDLQPKQGKIDIEVEVTEKDEPREFSKFGTAGKVCNAKVKDDSGQITLTLWNDQVDQVKVGDKVKITNGYVSEWQGEKQLSTGKFGQLEVVGGGAPSSEAPAPAEAPAEPEAPSEEPESSEEKIE